MQHILLVDDDPMSAKLLKFLLTDEGYEVTTAQSAAEALRSLDTNDYELILLDILMPGMDGLALCRQIRTTSQTPIIFITSRGAVTDKVIGLRAGGDDYISKPFDPNEVLARIWAVLRRNGQFAYSESRLKTPDLTLDPVDNKVTLASNGKTIRLTPIEARLLRCLVSNPGRSMTRDTLVVKVWGYDYEGESNQLDVYMKRLRGKIEEDPSNPQLLLTLRGVGYKYQPTDARVKHVTKSPQTT